MSGAPLGQFGAALAVPLVAALLLSAAWNMSEPHRWRGYWAQPIADRALLLITLALTVLTDRIIAIGVGLELMLR